MGYCTGASVGRDVQPTQIGPIRGQSSLILLLLRLTSKAAGSRNRHY